MISASGTYASPRRTTSWRGRFIEGVWHCDCDPRLPADHFQTKKAGINHGRWFYTCQKPQPKGCKFFLWEDDAQLREKQTVLANSRSEPHTPMKGPSKSNTRAQIGGLLTPSTGAGRAQASPRRNWGITQTPTKVRRIEQFTSEDHESWDESWDEGWDDEVEKIMSSTGPMRQPVFSPSTPTQTPQTATHTYPGKRKFDDFDNDDQPPPYSETAPGSSQSSVTTTATAPSSSVEVSATPTPQRYRDVLSTQEQSSSFISSTVLSILNRHNVAVPTVARDEISTLLDKQHLKTQGIIRGRDISWMALKRKDGEIKALKERIESLESEREMDRIVIDCLKKSGK